MQWKFLHRGQCASRDVHAHKEKWSNSILTKNLENWIQILSRSQMKCSQQPTTQGKKWKKKTKSQPSATQLSSLQFLVMRGHSISQAGCYRSGLRRINKFMWRKLAQHLPTICRFTLSPFHVNQILFFYLEDDFFFFLNNVILGKMYIPELWKAF